MGVKLDWEIDSKVSTDTPKSSDTERGARRRKLLFRFLLFGIPVLVIVLGIVGFFLWRIHQVDAQRAYFLQSTVEAEVTALRIGNKNQYMDFQRSATNDWNNQQSRQFDTYQNMKTTNDLELTGSVLDYAIENNRARVVVEEIIDGVPYSQVWFYWEYEDGWHHVPPDYTFWGDEETIQTQRATVRFQSVDKAYAESLVNKVNEWVGWGCGFINCANLPHISIDVVTDPISGIVAIQDNPHHLLLTSPYTAKARSDMPFDANQQIQFAETIADLLINQGSNSVQPEYPADASYLRSAIKSWLIGEFVQINTDSHLVSSIANNYGHEFVNSLITNLEPQSDISILSRILNIPSLADADLDWRDFLSWRLNTESDIIANRDENNWLKIVDTLDQQNLGIAYSRYNSGAVEGEQEVVLAEKGANDANLPQLRATVRTGSDGNYRDSIVVFNLIDNVWRRAG